MYINFTHFGIKTIVKNVKKLYSAYTIVGYISNALSLYKAPNWAD